MGKGLEQYTPHAAWALVALDSRGMGHVVDCCAVFADEIENCGSSNVEDLWYERPDYAPLERPREIGLWTWEGTLEIHGDESSLSGTWRRASAVEIIAFGRGKSRDLSKP